MQCERHLPGRSKRVRGWGRQGAEWGPTEILRERQSLRFHLRYPVSSTPGTIAVTTIMFPYDPMHQTFVNVYEGETLTSQMIVDSKHPHLEYFAGSRQGVFAVIR